MRKAQLKSEYAGLYPEMPAGTWLRAAAVAARIVTHVQRDSGSRLVGPERVLSPEHFTFTGGRRRRSTWSGPRERMSDRVAAA
jgi:hypothetical protein